MVFCRNCGKEIGNQSKTCPHCGAACGGSAAAVLSNGGVDYNELKFSANVVNADNHRKCVTFLNVLCFIMVIVEASISMAGDSAILSTMAGSSSAKMGLTLLYWFLPIIMIIGALIVAVKLAKQGIAIFKNPDLKSTNEKSTVANVRTLHQFTSLSLSLPILMVVLSVYTLLFYVDDNLSLYFREPELITLMYGAVACSKAYITVIFGVLGLSFAVYLQIVATRNNKIYSYFKSKVVPDAPSLLTDRNASKADREQNRQLVDAAEAVPLGNAYTQVCRIYTDRLSGEEIKFNIKTDAASTKFIVIKWLWRGIPVLLAIVLSIVWIAVAVTHSKVLVRPGSVGKIRLGDSVETVKNQLGNPRISSSEFCFVYTDMDEIENVEDLENAEIRQLCVYFVEGKVSEIRYDAGKTDNAFDKNDNVSERATVKSYYDSMRMKIVKEYVVLYKDGSVRVYSEVRQ